MENKIVITRNKYSWNVRMSYDEIELAVTLPFYPPADKLAEMEKEFEWMKQEIKPLD